MQHVIPLRAKVSKRTVSTTDSIPEAFIRSSSGSGGKVCLVCATNKSSYCCPRCYIPYCSSACFSRHNVQCTEGFNRQKVKEVLDAERKELDTGFDEHRAEGIDSATSFSFRNSHRAGFIGKNELAENLSDDAFGDEPAAFAEGSDDGDIQHEPGTEYTEEDFKSLPTRSLSRFVQMWTPWWSDDDQSNPAAKININIMGIGTNGSMRSRLLHVKCHITDSITEIRLTAPRLNTLVRTGKLSSDFGYQLVAMVLSYVVTMRTMNGDWKQHPEDALALLSTSSPVLDKQFQPRSILQVVEEWVRFQPPTVQKMSRKTIRTTLLDVLSVTRYWEFFSFALLECWLIALGSLHAECGSEAGSGHDDSGSPSGRTPTIDAAVPEESSNGEDTESAEIEELNPSISALSLVDVKAVLSAMDTYSVDVFMKPNRPVERKSKLTSSSSTMESTVPQGGSPVDGVRRTSNSESECEKGKPPKSGLRSCCPHHKQIVATANLLARKAFFMVLYTFEEGHLDCLREVSKELNEYIVTYCAEC